MPRRLTSGAGDVNGVWGGVVRRAGKKAGEIQEESKGRVRCLRRFEK
jgi:hypothetical protein